MDIHIKYLADVPYVVPTLAQWTYDAWSKYDPDLTVARAIKSLSARINRHHVPLTFVALDDDIPVGMASLKQQVEVPGYEDKTPWLGSIYLLPAYRGLGIGALLMQTIYAKTKELGLSEIYLFTSDADNVPWYEKMGWETFKTDTFHGKPITLMHYKVQ